MSECGKLGRPKGIEGKSRVFSQDELDSVIQFLKSSNRNTKYRNIVLILFNYYLGLKAVELCKLKVSDVFNGKEVLGGLIVSEDKSSIALRFNKELQEAIDLYIERRTQNEGKSFDIQLVLFKSQKAAFSPKTLGRLINSIYKKAGVAGITSHSGKRSFILNYIRAGGDIEGVHKLTGDVRVINTRKNLE